MARELRGRQRDVEAAREVGGEVGVGLEVCGEGGEGGGGVGAARGGGLGVEGHDGLGGALGVARWAW